jgi:ABC-type phosphate/phosphonate transport system substrate-binding protein
VAPMPAGAGGPVYWSDLVVRADDPAQRLADLAGRRVGYTILDSQSGFSALRTHLRRRGTPGFGAAVGPLTTPRRSIEAVAEGRADLAPIDSYAHALLRRHVPELTARVRVLERTAPTPAPMLVASPGADPALVARLRAALLELRDPALLAPLCLDGFAEPLPHAEYAAMEREAAAAERDGMHDLGFALRAQAA